MRKSLPLIFVGIIVSTIGLLFSTSEITGDTSGPNAGKCGAPSDNFTNCTSCHNGSTTTATGWITSNIPASGYIPGTTYTITATATYAALVRFGFQICPQNTSGVKLGTLVLTSTTTTQLVGSSKYVEHKSAGTTGTTGYHTWSFNWIAPVAGSGPLNFYGSFNCANNNGSESGDHIYNSILSVIEGGCSISATVTANGPTTFCAGGSVTLNAGSGFSTYHWSTNATTQTINCMSAGTYTVTVTNSTGCSTTATSPAIVVNPVPSVPVITPSGATTFCQGGSVTLSASNGASTYHWSTNASTQTINVTTAGSYTVTVTNAGGCSAVSTATSVTVNSAPAVPVITPSGATTFCQGGSVTLSASSGASTYHWSTNASTQTINVTTAGSYTVTVTNAGGCSAVSTATTVTVNSAPAVPVITPSGATTFCQGGSVALSATSGSVTYHWSTNASTQTINVTAAGSYAVTVTNAGGCSAVSTATSVTVNPSPAVPVITPSGATSFCQGGSVTLSATSGAATYHWSTNASTQTINVTTAGSYTVAVTNAGGCSAVSTVTSVTVNSLPTTSISGSSTICTGSSSILNAGAGFSAYHWSTNATTQTISVSAAGTYSVTITNATGCTGTASITVTVSSGLTPTITGTTTVCSGTSSVLNAGAGYSSYHWSTNASTQTISVSTAGVYAVTVTNSTGCSGIASTTVSLVASPTPTISGSTSICSGTSTVLNAGAGFSSYLWSTNASTQTITVTNAALYSVTVTNATGCSAATSATVTIVSTPTPTISGSSSICSGASTILNAGTGYSTYHWSTNAATQTISVSTTGTYSVTVTNATGCSGSASKTVTVVANPTPSITGLTAICSGSSTLLNAGTGFSTYHWSTNAATQSITVTAGGTYGVTVTNATGCSGIASATVTVGTTPTPTISGASAICAGTSSVLNSGTGFNTYHWSTNATTQSITVSTAGSYIVTVSNASGCTGSATKTVTVNANPTPSITGVSVICAGATTTLNAGTGFGSYHWSTNATTQSISVTTANTYSVTVTNATGCSGIASKIVTVNAVPTPTITGASSICGGSNIILHAGAGYSSYHWSTNSTNQNISVTAANTYSVTVTNAAGCSGTDVHVVTIGTVPTPTILSDSSISICQGSSVTLNADTGYAAYNWSNGETASSVIVNAAGSFTVAVADVNGCTGSSTAVSVSVVDTPICSGWIQPSEICSGDAAFISIDGDTSWTYSWNPGMMSEMHLTVTPAVSTTYILTATNSSNCSTTYGLPITVYPNPFTPAIIQSGTVLIAMANNASSYQWYFNGVAISGATDMIYNPTQQTGNFSVIISNVHGCESQSPPFGYFGVGISDINNSSFLLYPNPFTDFIELQNMKGENEIELMNAQGQILFITVSSNETETINTSQLAAGFYLLKVKSQKEISNRVVVKN